MKYNASVIHYSNQVFILILQMLDEFFSAIDYSTIRTDIPNNSIRNFEISEMVKHILFLITVTISHIQN